jgi:hypothetical protein
MINYNVLKIPLKEMTPEDMRLAHWLMWNFLVKDKLCEKYNFFAVYGIKMGDVPHNTCYACEATLRQDKSCSACPCSWPKCYGISSALVYRTPCVQSYYGLWVTTNWIRGRSLLCAGYARRVRDAWN